MIVGDVYITPSQDSYFIGSNATIGVNAVLDGNGDPVDRTVSGGVIGSADDDSFLFDRGTIGRIVGDDGDDAITIEGTASIVGSVYGERYFSDRLDEAALDDAESFVVRGEALIEGNFFGGSGTALYEVSENARIRGVLDSSSATGRLSSRRGRT